MVVILECVCRNCGEVVESVFDKSSSLLCEDCYNRHMAAKGKRPATDSRSSEMCSSSTLIYHECGSSVESFFSKCKHYCSSCYYQDYRRKHQRFSSKTVVVSNADEPTDIVVSETYAEKSIV